MDIREKVIVALDFPKEEEALHLVDTLGESAIFYKIGLELFLNSQGTIIDSLKARKKKIFLDLKFHDIPNTTAMVSVFAAKEKLDIFNVHASGGKKMMRKVMEETRKVNENAFVIAVTILTSLSEEEIQELFCSPWEAEEIKKVCGQEFKTVCPGVRPKWSATNDQERIMTPKEAVRHGCDYLVIGRPISKHADPKEAMELIIEEVKEGLEYDY